MNTIISYEKDEQGIVTLSIDMPDRSVNVMNEAFGEAFGDAVERLAVETGLAGVIITSAKDTFVAGADVDFIYDQADPAVVFQMMQTMKEHQRQLETMGIPVVAAINGAAIGGGWEIALAAHYRVAIDDSKIKVGLPEVTLGLLPGDGGVIRMVRILGLQAAFPYLTEGRQVTAREAKETGLIHELAADRADMMTRARKWILANPQASQPWDRKNYRMPGGTPSNPKTAPILLAAPAMLRKKTYRNYPAAEAILSAMVEGAVVDFDTALRIESRYFAAVSTGKVAKNMLSAFWYQLNHIKSGGSRPADAPPTRTEKVGVLGAGLMGHGVAYVTATAGMTVVLKDISQEKAEAGKAMIAELASKRVAQGRMSAQTKSALLDRIQATDEAADLQGCDLVIEAVFEDRDLKASITQEAEAQVAAEAVFASNTSTLPITGLSEASSRPENFIGLHFFSPVHRMKLVEIIVGQQTSQQTLAKAFDFVQKIGKTPIVVKDSRGFYTTRVFSAYVKEGCNMLAEGQHPRSIEAAGLQAGMPMGPLEVADMVGLNLAVHINEQTEKDLAAEGIQMEHQPADAVVARMVKEFGRTGKGQGAGFYDYPEDGGKSLWVGLSDAYPSDAESLSQDEMIERLMFIQALETVRCHETGVVDSVADANIGSIFGWGFAPFKGGTLQYITDYGIPDFVTRSCQLVEKYGSRFAPPVMLNEMVKEGKIFTLPA